MPISLFKHNAQAYEAALEMLIDTGKAAIIHPTGTGKSFIGFKLCEDNPEKLVCWLSPSEYIFKTQLENLAAVSDGYVPENLVFYTYAKLMNMSEAELAEIKPDYIILDEFHRAGAEFWGAGVQNLLNTYPNVPILGLSATNIRYLDNQRDMAVELFDGNIASEMTLGEAIVRGILNAPKYVLSIFSYQKDLEKYERRVKGAKSKAVRDEGERYLEALRHALEKADGLDEVFNKHIENKSGKYIVFCANYEHLCEMTEKASEWFAKVDSQPHIYTAYSDDPTTSSAFNEFKKDNSEHLKLLFCIDMLNEGVHVEDVCGVILLRPTVSPIIYKQQIGRALSASKKNSAVIFDIVLNIENLYSIGAIEEEMEIATAYYRSLGLDNEIVTEQFKVIDEVRDCIALFDKLNDTLTASWDLMFEHAKKYYRENGDLDVPKRYVTPDGFTLGTWINTQRMVHEGKSNGILTEERVKKLESIGMRWESVRDVAWEKNYAAAKAYYEENGNLLVNVSDNKYHGVALGRWIAQLRTYRKSGIQSAYLTLERIELLNKIGMVWDVPDYYFEKNYALCLAYYREHGNLDMSSKYVAPDGTRLGTWVHSIRSSSNSRSSKRAELTDSQRARLDEIGFVWDGRHTTTWERSYQAAVAYKKKFGNLDIPVAYITDNGVRLGRWIRHQRESYHTTLSDERKEKLDRIGMVWELPDPWEQKYQLVKRYYDEHGDINIPANYVSEGVWIARWLSEQVARMNGKPTGRAKSVKRLTETQINKLKSLGIRENVSRNDLAWEENYAGAKAFFEKNGHLTVPKTYVAENGKQVGRWLTTQRKYRKEGKLTESQIEKLNNIGIVWSYDDVWEIGYRHATEYYAEHGDLNVPHSYSCSDGYNLGKWIKNQRSDYQGTSHHNTLTPEKISRLERIGMVWDVLESRWQDAFEMLADYYRKNGHCKVQKGRLPEYNFDLLSWVVAQRTKYRNGELSEEQIAKLESIHFDWLTPEERRFENYYAAALRYYNENGNLNVPATYVDADGVALGRWVRKLQAGDIALASNTISKDRAARLASIGIV